MPLQNGSRVVAVAEIFNYRKGIQTIQDWVDSLQRATDEPNDLTVYSRFVAQIVTSLNISFETVARRTSFPSTMTTTTSSADLLSSDAVLQRAVGLLHRMMAIDHCRVYALDVPSNSLFSRVFRNQPSMSIRVGDGIVGA
ncbi:hypothetical protein SPRG_17072, partial [Saprolegnia parasitica CBS 223.65]